MHMSDTVRLRHEDFAESPYRSVTEPFLYCDGHIQLDIPIRNDGEIIQVQIMYLVVFLNAENVNTFFYKFMAMIC